MDFEYIKRFLNMQVKDVFDRRVMYQREKNDIFFDFL